MGITWVDDFDFIHVFKVQSGPTALSMIRGAPPVDTPRQPGSNVTTPMAGQVKASPLAQFQQQQRQWTPSPVNIGVILNEFSLFLAEWNLWTSTTKFSKPRLAK